MPSSSISADASVDSEPGLYQQQNTQLTVLQPPVLKRVEFEPHLRHSQRDLSQSQHGISSSMQKLAPEDQEPQVKYRDIHNDQKFRHLERVFSNITTSINSATTSTHHPTHYYMKPEFSLAQPRTSRRTCNSACRCICHSGRNFISWRLQAFKSTLGSFSFFFTDKLASHAAYEKTCQGQHARTHRFVYTFPAWLFHSTIAATYTDRSGGPELLIRVLNRISPVGVHINKTIFGAVWRGDMDTARRMLQQREASVFDVKGDCGSSLLASALRTHNFEIAELLLRGGADLFQENDSGVAAFNEILSILYSGSPVPASAQHLLDSAIPMDLVMERAGLSGLHKVVLGIRCLDIRDYLFARGRDDEINAIDNTGRTPLHHASARGDIFAVQALLEAGADPDVAGSSSGPEMLSPLRIACSNGHVEVVDMLIDGGADPARKFGSEASPLHALCGIGTTARHVGKKNDSLSDRIKIADRLIKHGADVNAVDHAQATPLDLASMYNQAALVEFLLDSGADPDHREWEGTNSLGNAMAFNACDSVALLLKRGVNHRNIDNNGMSILHYVAIFAHIETMEFLLQHASCLVGLDVALRDSRDRTPWQICDARAGASDELKRAFIRLLDEIARAQIATEDGMKLEDDEFFDALEY